MKYFAEWLYKARRGRTGQKIFLRKSPGKRTRRSRPLPPAGTTGEGDYRG